MAVVWVSGASSGLGLHTAQALQQAGWQVVGGARSFAGDGSPGFTRLPLDVSDPASIAAFCDEATQRFGPPEALVNAAGIITLGACEDLSEQELARVMDVNFLGMTRMVKAALPLMRAQGRGKIVNFSSINGLLATPFQGAYTASKHAIEGYSQALRMEVAPWQIQVMVVQPGDHSGGQDKYRARAARPCGAYEAACHRATGIIARDEQGGSDPAALGRKVAKAMGKSRLPQYLRVAKLSQHAAVWLHDLLPSRLFTRFLSSYYQVAHHQVSVGQDAAAKEDLKP